MCPQPLVRIPEAFNGTPAWLWELKLDGFRALAYVENGECRLIPRNGHTYRTFDPLRTALALQLPPRHLDCGPACRALQSQRPLSWRSVCALPRRVSFVGPRSAGGPGAAVRGPSPVQLAPRASRIGFSGSTPARQGSSLRSDPDKTPNAAAALGAPPHGADGLDGSGVSAAILGQYVMPEEFSPRTSITATRQKGGRPCVTSR